jgi:hypothetical protein
MRVVDGDDVRRDGVLGETPVDRLRFRAKQEERGLPRDADVDALMFATTQPEPLAI